MPFAQLQNLSKLMLVVKAYFLALAVLFFSDCSFRKFCYGSLLDFNGWAFLRELGTAS